MELLRALACVAEPPSDESRELARLLDLGELPTGEAWHDLFVLQLIPYASVYLGPEGMLGGEARDRIAGTWRALQLEPPNEPDHLAILLAAYASLRDDPGDRSPTLSEADAATLERRRHLARVFLWEHLLSWLPAYLQRARELATGAYRRWAELLESTLASEATRIPPPAELPLSLRTTPPLADPRSEGGERFIATLLAPAVSGLVLTHADLGRLAHQLDLGVRRGERAFVLKAFLSQDGPATLSWLAAEARHQAQSHRGHEALTGALARAWGQRADATASLLDELASDLDTADPPPLQREPQPITPEVSQ